MKLTAVRLSRCVGFPGIFSSQGIVQREGAGVFSKPCKPEWAAVQACRDAMEEQDWGRARQRAERGLRLAGLDPEASGILHLLLAQAFMQIGDLLRAEQELRRFMRAAKQCQSLAREQGEALLSLSHLDRLLGREDEAIKHMRQAWVAHDLAGRRDRVAHCRFELAWGYLTAGRIPEAERHLRALQAQQMRDCAASLQVDLQIATALCHSLRGDVRESDRIARAVLVRPDLQHRHRAEAALVLGCNALHDGELQTADALLNMAHAAAVEEWWPPQLERIHLARRRLVHHMRPTVATSDWQPVGATPPV